MSELLQKNDVDLATYIAEKREELRKMRFGLSGSGTRNSHAVRDLRREIARALTEANTRARKEHTQ